MSNSITVPASMQPPVPPPNALDTTPGANPTESTAYYKLSSGHIASLPQSSVPALLQQDAGAKPIPAPGTGEVLVKLSSGHAATLPITSLAALKAQDPNFTYIAGDLDAAKKMTPGFDALTAVAGPTTAAGAPASPEMQQEASGASDIMHGNIRQGAGKIWDAEKPHVIQGSLLEKAMQKIDPTFQGGVTKDQVEAHNAAEPMAQPVVDAAQFIDKDKHPVAKALAETAQNTTSPQSIAMLAGSGGAGLVDNPVSLGIAKRLIAGGFSVAAIASAYKNYKGFRAAVDSGDDVEAHYQLTHAVTSGALGVLAGAYAAEPVVRTASGYLGSNPFRTAASATGGTAPVSGIAGTSVAETPASTGVRSIASKFTGNDIQPKLQSGIRDTWNSVADAEGVPRPKVGASVRDMGDQVADSILARSKANYKLIDDATGNRFSGTEQALKSVNQDLRSVTNDTEEQDLLTRKTRLEMQLGQLFDDAAKQNVPKETVDAAKSDFKKAQAIYDTSHQIQMATKGVRPGMPGSASEPEAVNAKSVLDRMNKLYNNGRLQQAVGEDGAADLMGHAANALKAARDVSRRSTVAKTAAKAVGIAGAAAIGGDILKEVFEP